MKKVFFTILLLASMTAWANPVDKETAKESAREFLHSAKGPRKVKSAEAQLLTEAMTTPEYFIFNIGNENGFVLMSASDMTQPVLGYTDSGSFNKENIPHAMQQWLDELADGLQAIERHESKIVGELSAHRHNRAERRPTKNAVPMLVTSQWNQGAPYNDLCPQHESGTCATGCVATAVAQVMYYWRCPQGPCTNIPAYTWNYNGKGTVLPAMQSTTFDWDLMTDTYNDSSSPASKAEVAKLMRYVGQALQMGYGPASGAGVGMPPYALPRYFGYDEGCRHVGHDSFGYLEWEDLIYTEIAEGRPVLMNAHCAGDDGGGHEFVVDGYDGNGFYHINWGWGGMDDGYFLLTVMSPDNQGIGGSDSSDGYSMGQGIVVGLQPKGAGTNKPKDEQKVLSISGFSCNKSEVTRTRTTSDFHITASYKLTNTSTTTETFDHCYSFYDAEGNLVKEMANRNLNETIAGGGSITRTNTTFSFGADCGPGTYYLVPRSRIAGTEEWDTDKGADQATVTVTIDEDMHCFVSAPKSHDITVNSLELIGNKSVGTEQKVEVSITNNGSDVYEDMYLFEDGQWKSGNTVYLPGGKTKNVYFKYKPETTGTHTLALATERQVSRIFWQTEVEILENQTTNLSFTPTLLSESETVSGVNTIYGNQFRIQIKVRNGGKNPYNSYIEVSPWEVSGGMYWKRASYRQNISLPSRETVTIEFTIPNLNYGSTYNFHIDSNGCGSSNKGDYKFVEGITYWTSDGIQHGAKPSSGALTVGPDVVACKIPGLRNVPSVTIGDEYNPNLTFYYDEGATIASRTMTILKQKLKNIVFGNEAEELTIDGSHDFYLPYNLKVGKVAFTQNIAELGENDKWSTIILPFTPQSFSTEDGILNLQAEEFTGIAGNKLYFDGGESIIPNRPYIYALQNDDYNLSGKTLTISAENAMMEKADNISTFSTDYRFAGSLMGSHQENVYTIYPNGKYFQKVSTTDMKPFQAYFIANNPEAALEKYLFIDGRGSMADGINTVQMSGTTPAIYDLTGRKVTKASKGVYIINGKKVVRL